MRGVLILDEGSLYHPLMDDLFIIPQDDGLGCAQCTKLSASDGGFYNDESCHSLMNASLQCATPDVLRIIYVYLPMRSYLADVPNPAGRP